MATVAEMPSTMLSLWRKARQLYPVYAAISSCFQFPPPPITDVAELDSGGDDALLSIAGWIEEIDNLSQPHHLRSVLQDLDIASSDLCLSMWLHHFISKPARGAADRDKIDFLLSHYLRMNLPPSLQEGRPNYAAMKAVLEPVLGSCEESLPEETREVEDLIGIAERCRTLGEFEQSGIIRRGRELKLRAGDSYFTPPFLLAFTHFNAVVRRECGRLMNSDLKFIGDALDRLEKQGVTHIDCTAANWSDHEPLIELKNKWATWEMANADYSTDFFATLIGFRNAIDEALNHSIELSMVSVSEELRSIHSLLKEMRKQIDELPRKLVSAEVQVAPAAVKTQENPVATKPPSPKPAAVPAQLLVATPIRKSTAEEPSPEKAEPNPVATVSPKPEIAKSTTAPAMAKVVPITPPEPPKPTPIAIVPKLEIPAPALVVASAAPTIASSKPEPAKPAVTSPQSVPAPALATQSEPAKQVVVAPQSAPAPKAVTLTEPAKPVVTATQSVPEFPVCAPAVPPLLEEDITSQIPVEAQPVVVKAAPQEPTMPKPQVAADPEPPAEKNSAESPVNAAATAPTNVAAPGSSNAAKPGVDLEAGIARLQKTLTPGKRPAAVSIAVAGTRVLLTGAEASMFAITDDNKFAKAVQRAVMMRICLVSALETYSKTKDKGSVTLLVSTARGEQSAMRDLINECKSRKLAREEEILSATAKQLSAMLERAERIAR